MYQGIIGRYGNLFDVNSRVHPNSVITLGEGNTPLVRLLHLGTFGIEAAVYGKLEGQNPTGSFKDRGMTVTISNAIEDGRRATVCASTGNTSASAAAYSSRAGLESIVILPYGQISLSKLLQALDYGAKVVQIEGIFDDALRIAIGLEKTGKAVLVNSLNPHRIQGQQTVAFETVDELGRAPDYHVYPVGNGLNGAAHWLGYNAYGSIGKLGRSHKPKMIGVQASGAATMFEGKDIDEPKTIASAIRIGKPVNRKLAQRAVEESHGYFVAVTDEEIIAARDYLAKKEGIACEPASAATLAGLLKLHRQEKLELGRYTVVVLTITGSGLKDTDIISKTRKFEPDIVPATIEDVISYLKW